jgi:hypothetical protein
MVSALLDGRKTQTRRVLKPQPGAGATHFRSGTGRHIWDWPGLGIGSDDGRELPRIPFVKGDLLYVRECWRTMANWDDQSPSDLMASNALWPGHEVAPLPRRYDADGFETGVIREENYPFEMGRLRAAMHMPKRLSRLTLKVTDVRVERVKRISEADARAEGLAAISKDGKLFKFGIPDRDGYPGNDDCGWHWADWEADPRGAFRKLWDSINAPRGFGWEENPWVVAISFDVIRANVDQLPGPQAKAEDTERERSEATTTTRTGQ